MTVDPDPIHDRSRSISTASKTVGDEVSEAVREAAQPDECERTLEDTDPRDKLQRIRDAKRKD